MKKEKILKSFVCDYCGNTSKDVNEKDEHPFPYDFGWCYLYRIGFKFNKKVFKK